MEGRFDQLINLGGLYTLEAQGLGGYSRDAIQTLLYSGEVESADLVSRFVYIYIYPSSSTRAISGFPRQKIGIDT